MNAKELRDNANKLFSKRTTLLSLWQEIASQFYPQRADFTVKRVVGQEFASQLMTSYPIIAHRSLGDTLGTMLRPTAKSWFHTRTVDDMSNNIEARRWLENAENTQRRAMYDRRTNFVRATKEGDMDFAAFGQCAISIEVHDDEVVGPHLLYRNWHLRDMAWAENEIGQIGQIYRKWKPSVRTLMRLFPKTVADAVKRTAKKDPLAEVNCLHMVVESDQYDTTIKAPFISIYYDVDHDTVLEETGLPDAMYVIPRWQTVSGSQYAYSPATVAALPEARLIQAMTATLLEAGEKYTNPPMIAVQEAIRSDVAIYAGGITMVEADYDERLGEVLRPLTQDKGGFPMGLEMAKDSRSMIWSCFYLDKVSMPQRAAEMTAYEVGQRVQEYIRGALPIFEPMEMEYNGALCEMTFERLMRRGAFGSPSTFPKQLRGQDIQFRFESPLHDAIESEKEHKLIEAQGMIGAAMQMDPSVGALIDAKVALRDALMGAGVPATWTRTDDEVAAILQKQQQAANTQQLLANMKAGADVANTLGQASQSLGLSPAPTTRAAAPA